MASDGAVNDFSRSFADQNHVRVFPAHLPAERRGRLTARPRMLIGVASTIHHRLLETQVAA
ncbi:hypothetical protein [Paenarthrobacter sp. PH39-S1]|uniref:hypothetical protein n=1 Tax=Paenarthrobacter sp. PH39-S1 TaxID=3046204 RepID=UPI0024BBC44C|nr:hypothetical protein [Paenarthrobacter sp. PH39-S1]MDJ0354527.1 hypothetical protein [Paenarthrobacter sp. PH39-S1]